MGGAAGVAGAAAKELAPSLWGAIKAKLAPVVGGGVAVPSAFDWIYNSGKADDDPTKQKDFIPVWSTIREAATNEHGRQQEILLNSLIGGASGGAFGTTGAIGSIPGIVAKDTMLSGKRFMDRVQEDTLPTLVNEVAKSNTLQAETAAKANQLAADAAASDKMFKYIGTGLGALGLGLSGAALYKYLTKKDKKDKTSIKYRIQGKKGDPWSEAILDMPIKTPKLPQATREMMDAGLRRRLSKNVKYLSQKRDPNTGEMISYEDWEDMGGDNMSMDKYASALDSGLLIARDTFLPGLAGFSVAKAQGASTGKSALIGALAGLAPNVLGGLVGKLKGKRTNQEQVEHALNDSTILRALIPGYGAYEAMRRPKDRLVDEALDSAWNEKLDQDRVAMDSMPDEEEEDDDDDDFDKEASGWRKAANAAFMNLLPQQVKQASTIDNIAMMARDGLNWGVPAALLAKALGSSNAVAGLSGLAGAVIPSALGYGVGKLVGERTPRDHAHHAGHDSVILRHGFIPGYGGYEIARRPDDKELETLTSLVQDTPDSEGEGKKKKKKDNEGSEKSAAAGPPPPQTPPGQKGMAPARSMSGTPVAPGQSYKALPDVKGSSQAKGALQALMSQFGVQPPPSQQQGGQQPPPPQTPMGPPPPPAQ